MTMSDESEGEKAKPLTPKRLKDERSRVTEEIVEVLMKSHLTPFDGYIVMELVKMMLSSDVDRQVERAKKKLKDFEFYGG